MSVLNNSLLYLFIAFWPQISSFCLGGTWNNCLQRGGFLNNRSSPQDWLLSRQGMTNRRHLNEYQCCGLKKPLSLCCQLGRYLAISNANELGNKLKVSLIFLKTQVSYIHLNYSLSDKLFILLMGIYQQEISNYVNIPKCPFVFYNTNRN